MEQKCPKSVGVCLILTKIMLVLLIAAGVTAHWFVGVYEDYKAYDPNYLSRYTELLVLVYLSAVDVFIAMLSLHRLLKNVSRGGVFIRENIRMLKTIAYCIFAEALFCLLFSFIRPIFIVIFVAAVFFAIVVLAFRDLFVKALELREENDFTI